MNRIELIFSQALEEDFVEAFHRNMIKKYTAIPVAKGPGCSTPKLGDDIWPQLNAMMIVYCDDSDKEKILKIVTEIRKKYLIEGVSCFISTAEEF